MQVVVTGASGFLGRNFLLRAPRDWSITALYYRTATLPTFIEEHQLHHVRPLQCNLLDSSDVQSVARTIGGRADAVMYFAANGDPAASSVQPRWDLEQNATALVNFLEGCPADHLVYTSSGAVYDGLVGVVSPATPVAPRLPYAISKLAAESYARFFAEGRRTIGSYINVRFFGAYGPYEADRKITTRWLRGMAAGQREFVVRGDGKNLIDFMYVDDAIDGFLALLSARGTSMTVDFASGSPISVDDVVQAMAEGLGVQVTIRHEGEVPEYIRFRSVDSTMRERFGIQPAVAFADGFRRFNEFFSREARVAG